MQQVEHCLNAICQHSPSINRELPKSSEDGPQKMWDCRFVAVRGKNEFAIIGYLGTGHPNLSHLQTSYCDLPLRKPKLESELKQSLMYLSSWFYIYECATLLTVALKWLIFFKQKKVFVNLSLTLFSYPKVSSQPASCDTVPLTWPWGKGNIT
jgi:hypothetical protein